MAQKVNTYRPFAWCLIDERKAQKPVEGAHAYWHGGNGHYNARVRVTSGAYVIYKTRSGHMDGDLELKRGLGLNERSAKKEVEAYVKSLMSAGKAAADDGDNAE